MSAIQTDGTITIALSVTDRAASAAWYEEMMGFSKLYDADEMGWTEMATTTESVTLGLGEQMDATPGNAVPVFGVADLDAARAALEARDVRFDGETEHVPGMVKLATFYDPDGNALMMAQNLSADA